MLRFRNDVSHPYEATVIIKVLYLLIANGHAHPMSLTELALPDGRRSLPLGDVIGLIKKIF
jgi:hypothetical protein